MNTRVLWNSPCETLVEGICRQAAKDYLSTSKTSQAQYWREDAKHFFLSGWFEFLTGLDGKKVLNMLDKMKQGKE